MRKTYFPLVVLALAFIIGCGGMARMHIRSINDDPALYNDKTVTVHGQVVQIFALPFLDQGICKISDGTGEIWVKPQGRVPAKGDEIYLTGTVKVGITLANKSFGTIIIENEPEQR